MGILGFILGAKATNKLGKNKKGVNSFYKDLGKSVFFISDVTVELVQLFAKGVVLPFKLAILSYKGTKHFYKVINTFRLRRKVLIYGEKKTLTVIDLNKYRKMKAYEYYPNVLKATPKEKAN